MIGSDSTSGDYDVPSGDSGSAKSTSSVSESESQESESSSTGGIWWGTPVPRQWDQAEPNHASHRRPH